MSNHTDLRYNFRLCPLIGGDLAPSLGGGEKFRRLKFLNDVLYEKKFLMTFSFSHQP